MADPFELYPRVWFGPASTTYTEPKRFSHIVNCESSLDATATAAILHVKPSRFLFLKSYDDESPIVDQHLSALTAFVDGALQDPSASVLIHCFMGQNRSATLAIAVRCVTTGESASSVLDWVRRKTRRLIVSNPAFESQLIERFG